MSKRNAVGVIYFGVVLMTLLLRISSSLDVYSAVGTSDMDAYFTCVVQLLIFGTMSVSLYYLAVARKEGGIKSLARDFGFKRVGGKKWLLIIPLTICLMVVASGVSAVWQMALSLIGYTHTPSSTDYSNIGLFFKELALTAALPAIFEEISHRGLIYAGYRRYGWKFAIISGLLFSLMHQNIVQTGYTFVDGVVMALVMLYTGSIFPSIFMHFLNNAWVVFSGYVAANGGAFDFINVISRWMSGVAQSVIAVILCAALVLLLLILLRKRAVREGLVPAPPLASQSEIDEFELMREGDCVAPSGEAAKRAAPLANDIALYATICLGVVATAFSFAWGMMR